MTKVSASFVFGVTAVVSTAALFSLRGYTDVVRVLVVAHGAFLSMLTLIVAMVHRAWVRAAGVTCQRHVYPLLFGVFTAVALLGGQVLANIEQPPRLFTPVANLAFVLLDYGMYRLLAYKVSRTFAETCGSCPAAVAAAKRRLAAADAAGIDVASMPPDTGE